MCTEMSLPSFYFQTFSDIDGVIQYIGNARVEFGSRIAGLFPFLFRKPRKIENYKVLAEDSEEEN